VLGAVTAGAIGEVQVGSAMLSDDAVGLDKMAPLTRGSIIYGNAIGNPAALTVGTSGQYLTSDGTDASWGAVVAGTSWQAVQTGAFTAVAGNGYPINTTASAFTMTLPASPSVGDWVEIVDYAATFDTNGLTVDPGASNLEGSTTDQVIQEERAGLKLVYVDATQGWLVITQKIATTFGQFSAVGGSITYSGGKTIHTFLTSSNFTASGIPGTVDVLVQAGAGGGASQHSGGGGAGGYRFTSGHSVAIGTHSIVIGAGGARTSPTPNQPGNDGSASSGLSFSSAGGGGGGPWYNGTGHTGGCGGGGASDGGVGGSGNTPSTVPSQGYGGGTGATHSAGGGGGGGGGTAAVGVDASTSSGGGPGGAGTLNAILGTNYYWGGGGGGATIQLNPAGNGGIGGGGGGGNASAPAQPAGTGGASALNAGGTGVSTGNTSANAQGGDGGVNTGGGGGAGGSGASVGGAGGSGVVIISYPTP
jgi:hypothetical protein